MISICNVYSINKNITYSMYFGSVRSFFADHNVKCIRLVLFRVHWTDKSCLLTAEAIFRPGEGVLLLNVIGLSALSCSAVLGYSCSQSVISRMVRYSFKSCGVILFAYMSRVQRCTYSDSFDKIFWSAISI